MRYFAYWLFDCKCLTKHEAQYLRQKLTCVLMTMQALSVTSEGPELVSSCVCASSRSVLRTAASSVWRLGVQRLLAKSIAARQLKRMPRRVSYRLRLRPHFASRSLWFMQKDIALQIPRIRSLNINYPAPPYRINPVLLAYSSDYTPDPPFGLAADYPPHCQLQTVQLPT
jgi:hypothetical protein